VTESQSIGADSFAIHSQAMRDGRRIAFVREGSNLVGPLMARGAGHFGWSPSVVICCCNDG